MHILGCIHIYMPHMKSLVPNIQQGAQCTYLTYMTEQIWLTHSKYSSHGQHPISHVNPTVLHIYAKNTTQLLLLLSMLLSICVRNKYMHQLGNIFHICQRFHVHLLMMYVHICATYEVCA